MRCKICGAKLKKDGDICKNCYDEHVKKEKLKLDNEEKLYSIKRKYSPKYNLLKSGDLILLILIIILSGFSAFNTVIGILIIFLCLILFGAWMFFNKRRAMGTITTFYETKLKYRAKYLFVDREEIIEYDNIKDIQYFQQNYSQKWCKIGDIRFYTNGFLSGLTINDIPDIKENFEKIRDIINDSR